MNVLLTLTSGLEYVVFQLQCVSMVFIYLRKVDLKIMVDLYHGHMLL